jgi:hypothetical protein
MQTEDKLALTLKRMPNADKRSVMEGAIFTSLFTGAFAYLHYRLYIRKDFLRSSGHYKMNQRMVNCTPWTQMYFTWWRMPEQEWRVYHMFKPYYVLGQLDLTKEVLIPRSKTINGIEEAGFDVINPLFCYEGGKLSMRAAFAQDDAIKIDRAALIVNRGWIPARYRDKRSRPTEVNTKKLVKLTGCYMPGKNVHDYKVPNDPDANEWHNLALEDIGIFWDLPNFDECKYFYFHAVQFQGDHTAGLDIPTPAIPDKPDDLIESHYEWRWDEQRHRRLYQVFGGVSALSFLVGMMA